MDLDSPAFGAIRRTSAVDTVRARIWLGVNLGMLTAGQRLPTPAETARAFGVSEMTVRRAYRLLSDEGLVVRVRGGSGGSFIAEVLPDHASPALAAYREDAEHVHDLIDQRAVIEAGLAGLASGSRTAPELAEMGALVERMQAARDWADFREADAAFHEAVASAAHVPGAATLHRRVANELYEYFVPYRLEYLKGSNAEHGLLVEALASGDALAASGLAYAHVTELHHSMYVGRMDSSFS
ncbi:FadR/GntR family transcriptional regulator [Agreia bicolorata]|uniref:HTH gntR-type domain-containing protein n=1 Tax=Agreia bicolorata TaxID=110935 RepID=A0ABR5CBP8_9MICO|nr:FCD domain-containing protein [Agreia bicolorata]KJC63060.1 hypothetical protein TZ00_16940 [Agreia bicolorata]